MAQNNQTLTDIAIKRLSGKANTNAKSTVAQEPIGSTVQTVAGTVFAEVMPNDPINDASTHLFIVQSASLADPGTVMLVDFEVVAIGDEYQNDFSNTNDELDEGDNDPSGNPNTYHSYGLILSGTFESNATSNNFDTLASTGTTVSSAPFIDGYFMTGSRGKLQIVPEYVSSTPAGIGANNTYTPVLYNNTGAPGPSTVIDPTAAIDWYLDPYSGVLFVQDPVDFGIANPDGSSPNSDSSIPGVLRAFIYVGKYQDEVTFTSGDVNFKVSGSDDGFDVGNSDTINFVSGSAGVTVESNASSDTITIGKSTDNVTFNNITAIGDIIAENYIVSSSVTYMTQSFSSGSTIFGDTDDDTHQFTGSIQILHTGSTYGLQMSGSNFLIDYGDSGSVTLGEHNVGAEFAGFVLPITGSGLIISQSFTNEATHHNMVKIGETELVDISGSTQTDSFLINVREKALVVSSSFLDKPVVRFENGNHALFNGDTAALSVNATDVTLTNDSVTLTPSTNLNMKVTIGAEDGKDPSLAKYIIASQQKPSASPAKFLSYSASLLLPALGGALTASAVSSSGLLFASLSGNPTHDDGILSVVYNTGSGQFYFTGSYGAGGGDTTDLEASASAGIYFWTGSGEGSSIGLMGTASFTSSGAGLGVDFNESTNTFTYTLTPQDVFDAFDTANTGSFTASYANTASFVVTASHALTASKINVLDQESGNNFYGITFAELPSTGSVQLYSDPGSGGSANESGFGLTYNPNAAQVSIGGAAPSLILTSSIDNPSVVSPQTTYGLNSIITSGSNYSIANIQGPVGNTSTTISIGGQTHTINIGAALANDPTAVVNFNNDITIAGSASIEGDLIVRGAVTSIETENLNVQDQFILLNSGSVTANNRDSGIVIATNVDGNGNYSGSGLFLDANINRFAVAKGIAWDRTSEITTSTNPTMEYVVTVTSSAGVPPTPNWGNDDFTSYGNMYVDTQTGDIYIYGG